MNTCATEIVQGKLAGKNKLPVHVINKTSWSTCRSKHTVVGQRSLDAFQSMLVNFLPSGRALVDSSGLPKFYSNNEDHTWGELTGYEQAQTTK